MKVHEILARLQSLGDAARRRHIAKSGAPDDQSGVKFGDIRAVAKTIKADDRLAWALRETGNLEAQLLAAAQRFVDRGQRTQSSTTGTRHARSADVGHAVGGTDPNRRAATPRGRS